MNLGPDDATQSGFAYRFDWGLDGLRALAPACDVVVVVDVLRFTSAVSAAVEAGACVFPFRWRDEGARAFADEHDAVLAGPHEAGGPSLSPTDLLDLDEGSRIVLPSPHGATLAVTAQELGVPFVLAGALRNASATARRARDLAHDGAVGVIAAGERRSTDDGPLRPCVEDLVGAGAILAALDPSGAASPPHCSPEAAAARGAYLAVRDDPARALRESTSGRELCRRGRGDDVATAGALDATRLAAQLTDGAFVAV